MVHQQTVLRHNRVAFHTEAGEEILQRVERHWEKMRTPGEVPSRMSIQPQPLDHALSHCFVLERVAQTHARFRVAGQALTHVLGQDARNLPLGALFTVDGADVLGELVQAVCEGPEIVEMPLTASRGLVRGPLRGRLLMMPLTDRNGQVTRIFGALVLDGAPGRKPLCFDVDTALPLRRKAITPLARHIARLKSQIADMSAAPVAERPRARVLPTRDVDVAVPAPVSHPHLRLVVDNT